MTKGDDQVWFAHTLGKRPEVAKGGSMKIEPVACYAAHRITPEGTTEFFGYADKPLEPATMFYTEAQMRQLGEACVLITETEFSTDAEYAYGKEIGALLRELIKEMLS